MANRAAGLETSPPIKHNLHRLNAYERARSGSIKLLVRYVSLIFLLPVEMSAVQPAVAVTRNISDGGSLTMSPGTASPLVGDIFNLQGPTATLSQTLTLPSSLTISSMNGGSTITLSGNNGFFDVPNDQQTILIFRMA